KDFFIRLEVPLCDGVGPVPGTHAPHRRQRRVVRRRVGAGSARRFPEADRPRAAGGLRRGARRPPPCPAGRLGSPPAPARRSLPPEAKLIYTQPGEAFGLYVQVALIAGVVFAMPFIMYQLWRLIAPLVPPSARRFAIPFVLFTTLGFVAGAAFTHYIAFP